MTLREFFKMVPARQFFPKYCPQVKRYYHKLNNCDGNMKFIDFTNEDKAAIREGINKFIQDLHKVKA